MEKLLLHVCCGPCSLGGLHKLKDFKVIFHFQNSNIFPEKEHQKRLIETKKVAYEYGYDIIDEVYDHEEWLNFIKGLEDEPERGKRCHSCFEHNLEKTAKKAKELDIHSFTTSLTTSPQKESKIIFEIAKKIASKYNLNFVDIDFKKQNGFAISSKLSKKLNLYRQNYCGCEFSFNNNIASPSE